MFKNVKDERKKNAEKKQKTIEEKFKEPKLKASRAIQTHQRERTEIEKIFYLFSIQGKRRTAFRMVIDLPEKELERNVYMITECLLNTLITDTLIDKLFYVALTRILKNTKTKIISKLCIDYLKAQMNCSEDYLTFFEFLLRHFKSAILEHRDDILNSIRNEKLRERILKLKDENLVERVNFDERFYFSRQCL